MSGRLHLIAIILFLFVINASCVYAQYDSNDKCSAIGFAFELNCPSSSALTDIKGVWTGPVLQYNTMIDKTGRPQLVMSLGSFSSERAYSKGSMLPLKATYIKRYSGTEENGLYIGAGLSAAWVKFQGAGYNMFTREYELTKDKGIVTGINVIAGYELGSIWYAELGYNFLGKLTTSVGDEIDFSGLSLTVGSRVSF